MKKIPELLNYDEKKRFIQILILVGGLLTALNRFGLNLIPLFTLFIISSLTYLIWISVIQKTKKKPITDKYTIYFTEFLSGTTSYSFAGILAMIGIQGMNATGLIGLIGVFGLIALYIILGSFLMMVITIFIVYLR